MWARYQPLAPNSYSFGEAKTSTWEAIQASFARNQQLDAIGRRNELARAAAWQRHQQIARVLGNNIPMTSEISDGRYQALPLLGQITNLLHIDKVVSNDEYEQFIEEARRQQPDKFRNIEDASSFRQRLATSLQARRSDFDNIVQNSDHPIMAELIGGIGAGFTDPVNLLAMAITGGASAEVSIGRAMFAAAVANGATEAAQLPFRAYENNAIEHREYGWQAAVFDLGTAAIVGGAFEGGGRLIGSAIKKFRPQETLAKIKAEPLAARQTRIENVPDPAARAIAREANDKIEASLFTSELDHEDEILVQNLTALNAVRAQLGETIEPLPNLISNEPTKSLEEIFNDPQKILVDSFSQGKVKAVQPHLDAPPAPEAMAHIRPEILQNDADIGDALHRPNMNGIFESIEYRGRVIHQGRFDPNEIEANPKAFQYKEGGDAQGVTDRLKSVTKWDNTRSGKTIIFEDIDGNRFVADGHQRRGLAKRLKNQGDEGAMLDGYLFRERDGWDAPSVRVIAAIKNISEGSGTIIDAAKIFRDAPHEVDGSIPMSGAIARDGFDLAKLSPEAFGAVVNKALSERDGAIIGRIAADNPDLHMGMAQILKGGNYSSRGEAEIAVRKLLQYHWEKDVSQNELFDLGGLVPHLFHEQNKAINAAISALKKHENAFSFLVAKSELFENVGNQLARDVNEAEAQVSNAASAVLARLAENDGPVKNAILQAAERLAKGEKPSAVIDDVVKLVREASQNKTIGQVLFEAQAPKTQEIEHLANIADNEARMDIIGEDVAPFEKDELTMNMFDDFVEQEKVVKQGEADLQAISVCAPRGQ